MRFILAIPAICLFIATACVPEDPKDPGTPDPGPIGDDDDDDDDKRVDETGYMDGGLLTWSVDAPLVDDPGRVWVLGLPGALDDEDVTLEGGGKLVVTNRETEQKAKVSFTAGGGFVAVLDASAGDAVDLVYTEEGVTLEGDLQLDEVPEPAIDMQQPETAPIINDDGTILVDAMLGVFPPFILFNTDSGDTAYVATLDDPVSLVAELGDEICVVPVTADALTPTEPHVCFVVED